MNEKLLRFLPLTIAVTAIGLRYFSLWCIHQTNTCAFSQELNYVFLSFIKPIYLFSLVFLPIGIIMLFIRKDVLLSWFRLARWWVPLSALVIIITPSTSGTWMPIYFIGKTYATLLLAGSFTLISLALITWKSFSLRSRS